MSDMTDNRAKAKKLIDDLVIHPSKGSYWAIRYPIGRLEYALMYVALPMAIFLLLVILPLYLFTPEIFSAVNYGNLSYEQRAELVKILPLAVFAVSIPFLISVSMAVVGQIKRLKDVMLSPWIAVVGVIPFAIFALAFALCILPTRRVRDVEFDLTEQ